MAQSHSFELITADQALAQAALDGSSRPLRELLGRLIDALGGWH